MKSILATVVAAVTALALVAGSVSACPYGDKVTESTNQTKIDETS